VSTSTNWIFKDPSKPVSNFKDPLKRN
jgi:hypothetical protein